MSRPLPTGSAGRCQGLAIGAAAADDDTGREEPPLDTHTARAGYATITADTGSGAGGPFLLLHGIGVSSRYFERLIPLLAAHGRTVAVDLPGFGRARTPGHAFTVEHYAAVAADLADRLSLGPCTVVGHSMGAQIASRLTLDRPDLVRALVLVGPVMAPQDRTPLRAASRLLLDMLTESPRSNAIVLGDYVRCGPSWYLKVLPSMLGYRMERDLPAISAPVTVVRGARDPIARADFSRALAGLAPKGRLAEIPGAPHVAMHARPDLVAHQILQSA